MRLVRRLLLADEPQEARFFALMSAFGLAVAVVYWFVSYEAAGTVLLIGFGIATGVMALRLVLDPSSRLVRRQARGDDPTEREGPGGGTGDVDRPFLDESGRLPDETIAPFAVGLGVALAATSLIFGAAPAIVGLLPFAWGAWAWLSGAGAELEAQEGADAPVVAEPTVVRGGTGSPPRGGAATTGGQGTTST
ncbi:MAG TPA: hypothetical protein VKA85_08055 [Candidatus Limnocylindrales bacterium]|nr:hypothetical protein [Candidatus Limnocylindrales bacterium]